MVSLRWTVNNITIEINCERDLEPTHSTLMFAQKQFLGIRKLWLAINSFLYSPDYLYVVISLCYCMLFLLRLHQHCQCPVCSVTQSRHVLFKQNDNIALLLQSSCKPLARHGLSLKGAAGILWVIEAGRQKERFKGRAFALWMLLWSLLSV